MADYPDPAKAGVHVDETLGDYHLTRLLYKGTMTKTYRAKQSSVGRYVILVRMMPAAVQKEEAVNGFLADVRAKAKLNHPVLGKVYEAVNGNGECYFTKEELPGKTLEDIIDQEEKLSPLEVSRILRALAEAMVYCQKHNVAIIPISPHYIFISKSSVRVGTVAIAGEPNKHAYQQSKFLIGELLLDILSNEGKGQTRVSQVLNYMTKRNASQPLTWPDVLRKITAVVESTRDGKDDLAAPTERLTTSFMSYRVPFRIWRNVTRIFIGAAAALVIFSLITFFKKQGSSEGRAKDNKSVLILEGEYETPNGDSVRVKSFLIDSHEVTIAEYQEFLADLETLSLENRKAYDHPDQPDDKEGHLPRGWYGTLNDIQHRDKGDEKHVDLDYPIVNIDWWDAYAYAEWKGRRLPSSDEWVAVASKIINTQQIYDRWTSVGKNEQDKSYLGLVDIAGGVREWLSDVAINPAYPYDEPKPVAAGASFNLPYDGIYARHFMNDRNAAFLDLGFRTVVSK